jgi:Uma2 family endonuclease
MSVAHQITEEAYQRLVLSDPERKWELYDGQLREKPGMSWGHNRIVAKLNHLLWSQLDERQFVVFFEGRVRRSVGNIFLPDLAVIPAHLEQEIGDRPGVLAIVSQPLPLVVEVWSSSTGEYDVDMKIPEYQRRGDLEIWRIHPYEKTLTTWRRLPGGTYDVAVYHEGVVAPIALPGVTVPLAELFRTWADHS